MAEEAQKRVSDSITKAMEDLDRSHLRKMQGRTHYCSAKCCESTASMDSVQRCMENCSTSLQKAQGVIENEMQDYQDRLDRCSKSCQDKVKDEIGSNPQNFKGDMNAVQSRFDGCLTKCADEHITLLGSVMKRVMSNLDSLPKP